MINWVSEADKLPMVGQEVLVATPRQFGGFWDIRVLTMRASHEGVIPTPVNAGDEWPTDYHWGAREVMQLITGNGYWATLSTIELPPKAEHDFERGYHCIRQIGAAFIPQNEETGVESG